MGGTVTASRAGGTGEDLTKAFDGILSTKWYASDGKTMGAWIAYQFAYPNKYTVTSYAVASASDEPLRDPYAWRFQGSDDGATWLTIDTRTGETFSMRLETKRYVLSNTTAFSRYRFYVDQTNGSSVQIAEIQLFGY
jgi:hypothetical protein